MVHLTHQTVAQQPRPGCAGSAFHLRPERYEVGSFQMWVVCDDCGGEVAVTKVSRECRKCGALLWFGSDGQDYCSDACKQRAYRERRGSVARIVTISDLRL
jgi:hypothetical protein